MFRLWAKWTGNPFCPTQKKINVGAHQCCSNGNGVVRCEQAFNVRNVYGYLRSNYTSYVLFTDHCSYGRTCVLCYRDIRDGVQYLLILILGLFRLLQIMYVNIFLNEIYETRIRFGYCKNNSMDGRKTTDSTNIHPH